MGDIPDFITHYSRGTPFLSISSLAPMDREKVLAKLTEANAWGLGRFKDEEYLVKRIETEKKIQSEFEMLGGKPELSHPIYFFLGINKDFETHPENQAHKIPLHCIPETSISFTYGDSLLAFDKVYRKLSGKKYESPLCSKVFLKRDLKALVTEPAPSGFEPLHIEAQLWVNPLHLFEF